MNQSLLLLLALALLAPAAMAYTPLKDDDGDEIEPNPYIAGNVTISNHKPACEENVLCYFDDSNDQSDLADHGLAIHTDRVDEPIQFKPQNVDCQYYGEDTEKKSTTSCWATNVSDKSWLDTANWAATKEANDTFERVTRNGAHALHFKNPGTNPGTSDVDTYVLDFADLTTDVAKYRLLLGMEVVTQTGDLIVVVYDTNGTAYDRFDYRRASSFAATGPYTLSNSTGVTFWDPLVTDGLNNQGGVANGISKIEFQAYGDSTNGEADIYIYALGLDVRRYRFGLDEDGEPVHNMTYTGCDGVARTTPLGHTCLTVLDPSFDYQNIKDLKVAYIARASTLPADDVAVIAGENDDDKYPWKTNYRFAFHLPKQLDLTYADDAVRYVLPVKGSQHEVVKAGGADKLKDIEKKSVGDEITLASSVTTGRDYEVEVTVLYTDAQLVSVSEVGFLGLPASNPLSRIWVWLSGLALVGVVFAKGLRRGRRGGR